MIDDFSHSFPYFAGMMEPKGLNCVSPGPFHAANAGRLDPGAQLRKSWVIANEARKSRRAAARQNRPRCGGVAIAAAETLRRARAYPDCYCEERSAVATSFPRRRLCPDRVAALPSP